MVHVQFKGNVLVIILVNLKISPQPLTLSRCFCRGDRIKLDSLLLSVLLFTLES